MVEQSDNAGIFTDLKLTHDARFHPYTRLSKENDNRHICLVSHTFLRVFS